MLSCTDRPPHFAPSLLDYISHYFVLSHSQPKLWIIWYMIMLPPPPPLQILSVELSLLLSLLLVCGNNTPSALKLYCLRCLRAQGSVDAGEVVNELDCIRRLCGLCVTPVTHDIATDLDLEAGWQPIGRTAISG
jgi:hypothetical protein